MANYVDDRYILACCKSCMNYEFVITESVCNPASLSCSRLGCLSRDTIVYMSWGAALIHLNKKKMANPRFSDRIESQIEMINLGYSWIEDSMLTSHVRFINNESDIRPKYIPVPLQI